MTAPVLQAIGMHKRYGGVRALRGVDLELHGGEIHGLTGENGSGKSTLLKILAGQVQPDEGVVLLDGNEVRFADASRAMSAGIATVTQETTLVHELSVAENIFLGPRKQRSWRGIDWRATRARAREVLDHLNLDIPVGRPVGALRPDEQQMVEIARALSMDARVLILDEPTSSLPDDQVAALFAATRRMRERGVAIVFVSHRMDEVFELVDRVTILRDGERVASGPIGEFDRRRLIHLMIGRELEELTLDAGGAPSADPVLRVRGFTVPGRVHDVDLEVERGEIVGLAGLVGAGRSELLEGLFGLDPTASGSVEVDGAPAPPRSPRDAIGRGLAYVPADRKRHGLVLDMSVRENLLMARTAHAGRLRRPSSGDGRRIVADALGRLRIATPSDASPVGRLSGGNQQKVVLGKWLATQPKVLLLDEPTRGIDVGAKADVYKLLDAIKETGVGIVVSSSEVSELLLLCDRIVVMHRGRQAAALSREDATDARITHYAMGHA